MPEYVEREAVATKHADDCRLAAILNENPQPPDAGSE